MNMAGDVLCDNGECCLFKHEAVEPVVTAAAVACYPGKSFNRRIIHSAIFNQLWRCKSHLAAASVVRLVPLRLASVN